jgi:prepilin-type N-terminal cleavage/methylation domain-containing protein
MKTHTTLHPKKGFTLIELMIAMAIAIIIIMFLISITYFAMDAWGNSRSELRAARQARAMVETMAADLEAFVSRSGNDYEWLTATQSEQAAGDQWKSSNQVDLVFFTAPMDRYNGYIQTPKDKGGDVACVGYQLNYRDPIDTVGEFKTFVFNRMIVDPDQAFLKLLAKPNLLDAFSPYMAYIQEPNHFVCENIHQFTMTFHVEVSVPNGAATVIEPRQVTLSSSGSNAKSFKVKGNQIEIDQDDDLVAAGRIKSVEISVTVLSDAAIDLLRARFKSLSPSADDKAQILKKYGYQYAKRIEIPFR